MTSSEQAANRAAIRILSTAAASRVDATIGRAFPRGIGRRRPRPKWVPAPGGTGSEAPLEEPEQFGVHRRAAALEHGTRPPVRPVGPTGHAVGPQILEQRSGERLPVTGGRLVQPVGPEGVELPEPEGNSQVSPVLDV